MKILTYFGYDMTKAQKYAERKYDLCIGGFWDESVFECVFYAYRGPILCPEPRCKIVMRTPKDKR